MSNKLQLLISERDLIAEEMPGFKGALLTYAQEELRNLDFEISILAKSERDVLADLNRYNKQTNPLNDQAAA